MLIKRIVNFFSKSIGLKSFCFMIFISALCVFLQSSTILIPFFIERFINLIQEGSLRFSLLFVAASWYIFVFVFTTFLSFLYGSFSIRIKNRLQLFLVRKVLVQNPSYIKTKGEGFFSNLMERSLTMLMEVFAPYNISNFFMVIQSLAIICILFYKNLLIGGLSTLLFVLYIIAYFLNKNLFSTVMQSFIEKSSKSMALLYDFIKGNRSLLFSEKGLSFADCKIEETLASVRTTEFHLNFFFDLIFTSVSRLFLPCIHLTVIGILGYSVADKSMMFGSFVLITTYYAMLQSSLNSFQGISDCLFHAEGALESFEAFVAEESFPSEKKLQNTEEKFFYRFSDVSFSFGEKQILKKSSLDLDSGKHYALVGFSGLGKSSLVSLLLGLKPPTTGNIFFLNESNLLSDVNVFKSIAVFCQNSDIFNLSLADNIFLGEEFNQEEYFYFLNELGLSSLDGRLLGSGGEHISGGERQRVALARFLHQVKKSQYYLIDEGFVSLDAFTKEKMLTITSLAIKGKTGICITHDDEVFQILCDSVICYKEDESILLKEKQEDTPLRSYLSSPF